MIRSQAVVMLLAPLIVCGCKPAPPPAPIQQVGDSRVVVQNRERDERPQPRKPDQPPIQGDPDLEHAQPSDLVQWLGHEDVKVRTQASDRLLATGSAAIPLLIKALDDDNYHVRAGAVFSLGCLGPQAKSAVPRLNQLAEEDPWEAVRDAAKFAVRDISGD